jgi:hypothetical protein
MVTCYRCLSSYQVTMGNLDRVHEERASDCPDRRVLCLCTAAVLCSVELACGFSVASCAVLCCATMPALRHGHLEHLQNTCRWCYMLYPVVCLPIPSFQVEAAPHEHRCTLPCGAVSVEVHHSLHHAPRPAAQYRRVLRGAALRRTCLCRAQHAAAGSPPVCSGGHAPGRTILKLCKTGPFWSAEAPEMRPLPTRSDTSPGTSVLETPKQIAPWPVLATLPCMCTPLFLRRPAERSSAHTDPAATLLCKYSCHHAMCKPPDPTPSCHTTCHSLDGL